MLGVRQKAIFADQRLLPWPFLIGLQPIGLGNTRRSRIFQNIVIACIDAGVAFDALGVNYLPIKVEDLTTDIDALRADITAVAAASTLCHTCNFFLYRGDVHE